MISCIFIKDNNISEIRVKNMTEENIYKKCGYKNNTNFSKIYDWKNEDNTIELWSKTDNHKNNVFDLFKKYNLNVSNKALFLMKHNNNYISFKYKEFTDFFKINENIKNLEDVNSNMLNDDDENENDDNNNNIISEIKNNEENLSEYSYNSELSYDLYSYSSDE